MFKGAETWSKKRMTGNKMHSKEKHVEFAKDLFKMWDDDNSGVLDLNEIAHPLVALGLSTDSKFVAKLIQSLDSKKNRRNDTELQCTLKDFVNIFKADKLGERISKIVKQACIENKVKGSAKQVKCGSVQVSPRGG